MESASILKRFIAFCIDYVILIFISAIAAFAFVRIFGDPSNLIWNATKTFLGTTANIVPGKTMSGFAKLATVFSFYLTHVRAGVIICGIITFAYFIYFEQSKKQATIGKSLLGLKVKTSTNTRISLLRATQRMLLFATPALFFYFLVFFAYTQCLNVINISFHLFKFKIVVPKACVTLFTAYTICYILWFIPIFFTKEKTTVYDMLSNTRVKE